MTLVLVRSQLYLTVILSDWKPILNLNNNKRICESMAWMENLIELMKQLVRTLIR
jgi:hypothetical protein